MLKLHTLGDNSNEAEAAEQLGRLASRAYPGLEESKDIILEIFSSVQCFGQNPQDIDLLVFYADYRPREKMFKASNNKLIHSFCLAIEVKGHPPEKVTFEGPNILVEYNGEKHNVTSQSEGQKQSVRKYIKRNSKNGKPPWINNLIWLRKVPNTDLPKLDTNILGSDLTWQRFIDAIAMLKGSDENEVVKTFSARVWFDEICSIFSKRLETSKIGRKRLEVITKTILDRNQQQYASKIGKQLLIYKGRGGTGKTVRLIQIAHQTYNEQGFRVLILTYNKALVADMRRLLTLLGVKDAVGDKSIAVKTIHSFMYEWLIALEIITHGQEDFLSKYEEYKEQALKFLNEGALSDNDFKTAKATYSRLLSWDLILIDESQDWPETERDFLYKTYGHKKIIIADGVDQFVRGVSRIDWRKNIDKNETQIVPLTKSLRLKSMLCETVGHFAEQIEFDNWNLEPVHESHGGKVIVIEGNAFSEKFHKRIIATSKDDGNRPVDMLLCVPPSWVVTANGRRESTIAQRYRDWNLQVWDGVDPKMRDDFPTSLDQFRIVQYESCRGLEGWVVVNFGLDEFFEYKRSNPEITKEQREEDMYFNEEEAALDYAKKWLMIPLTRAIDTLVIHISDRSSFVGKTLVELHNKFPSDIEWIQYD